MAVIATDDFNRADAVLGAPNWGTVSGCSPLEVRSNTVKSLNDPSMSAYIGIAAPNDGEAGVTVVSPLDASGAGMGPAYRVTQASNSGYFVLYYTGGMDLYSVVSGSYNLLQSYSGTITGGDIIALRCVGTTITVRQNGTVRITVTDSSLASGRAGLFGGFSTGNAGDLFYIDDLSGGGSSVSDILRRGNKRVLLHF